jgi:hypothetical protein
MGRNRKTTVFDGLEKMNRPAARYGVSDVFRHAGLDPASSLSFSGFLLSQE